MTWISGVFSRNWRNLHLAAILLLSAVLIYGNDQINGYVSEAELIVYQPFSRLRHSIQELSAVNTENRRLRQSLVEASLRLTQMDEMKRENARLRSVLGFEPPVGYSLHPARVISVTGDKMPVSVAISRGETDSVFADQTIINQEGLVGRISSVSPDFAAVCLLTDPANRVAARVARSGETQKSGEMGIIRYVVSRGMILDNFPIQGNVKRGDLVLSSGMGGIYPPGLVVGTVDAVVRPEGEPFCKILVRPAANFSSLQEVYILRLDSI